MVARYREHFMAAVVQTLQKLAGFAKLLGPGALREVAADDDQIRLQLVDLPVDRLDQPVVMGPKVEIGEMDDASHEAL